MSDQITPGSGARYRAFISYSRADRDMAAALQRRLERYVLPRTLRVVTAGVRRDPRPLKPIFRDESELVPGQDLSARIRQGLAEADFLIVVCSPAAASSRWVDKEVADFVALGRRENILAIVVAGEPNAVRDGRDPALECLPAPLRDVEPLWVNWRDTAAEDRSNFLRVVATLLSLHSFDDLIRRDAQFQRRQMINRLVVAGIAALAMAGAAAGFGVMAKNAAIAQSSAFAEASRKAADEYEYESAARLALAGWRRFPGPDAEAALVAAVDASRRVGPPITVPEDVMTDLAFSPDGKLFATSAYGQKIRIYDAATRKPIGTPFGSYEDGVWRVVFSPDGKRVAGCDFQTIRVFDVATHKQIGATMTGHTKIIFTIAFSKDSQRLASASDDHTVRLWDATTGRLIGAPLLNPGTVWTVDFSPDGKTLASAGDAGWVRFWDATTGKPKASPSLEAELFRYSPDGKTVATAHGGEIQVWDAVTFKPVGEPLIKDGEQGFKMIAYSPDSKMLASLPGNNEVRVWDIATGKPVGTPFIGHSSTVTSVSISPDGKLLGTTSHDSTFRFWDLRAHDQIGAPMIGSDKGSVDEATFSPDGKRLVSAANDMTIRLWDASTGRQIGSPLVGLEHMNGSAAFSPDGKRVIGSVSYGGEAGKDVGEIRLWDANTGLQIGSPIMTKPGLGINDASFANDSKSLRILVSRRGYGYTFDFWFMDPATGQPVGAPFTGLGWPLTSLEYSRSGARLATGSEDTTVRLWDVTTRKQINVFKGHLSNVRSVTFSPDEKWLASGSNDKTIRRWDIATGQQVGEPLLGHTKAVTSVAFSPDGARIASSSNDKTIRLWDAATGKQIGAPLLGHEDKVWSIAFSPDGKRLASSSRDKTIRLWDVDRRVHLRGEALIKVACAETLPGDLSSLRLSEKATAAKITLDYDLDPCRPKPWWTKLERYFGQEPNAKLPS